MNFMNKTPHERVASPLLSGLLYAFAVMAIGTVIASFIVAFSEQTEKSLPTFAYIIHIVSLLIGGFIAGKRTGTRGWYYGGLLGIGYAVIIFVIAFLAFDRGIGLHTLLYLGASFAAGAFGGMIGVNAKK